MQLNNIYPATYQPYFNGFQQNQPYQYQYQQPVQNDGIKWVQGDAGAKAAHVDPGKSDLFMDSENPFFYIKSVDLSGIPSLEKYRFEKVAEEETNQRQFDQFITRDEFEKRISEITSRNNNRKQQPKKEVVNNG